jgi:hypothetical protein
MQYSSAQRSCWPAKTGKKNAPKLYRVICASSSPFLYAILTAPAIAGFPQQLKGTSMIARYERGKLCIACGASGSP